MTELIWCLQYYNTVHQVSKPHSSNLLLQICIVHIRGGTMTGKYTKELKWHTSFLDDLWLTRFVLVLVRCF